MLRPGISATCTAIEYAMRLESPRMKFSNVSVLNAAETLSFLCAAEGSDEDGLNISGTESGVRSSCGDVAEDLSSTVGSSCPETSGISGRGLGSVLAVDVVSLEDGLSSTSMTTVKGML